MIKEAPRKNPLTVTYCKASDHHFIECAAHCTVRAIGNINPKFPNEQLKLKFCNNEPGECKHQTEFFKLPTLPRFFLQGT